MKYLLSKNSELTLLIMASSGGVMRLQKELKTIITRKQIDNFIAMPDSKNIFEWHFLIFGL
jgi:ubiquitin-protein ligase